MAGSWGADAFERRYRSQLENALEAFPENVQKAILAASYKGAFAKGTWDDCVMNRVTGASGFSAVADQLGVNVDLVSRFVSAWDNSGRGTEFLQRVLQVSLSGAKEKVEHQKDKHGRKIVKVSVWKSYVQQFEEIMEAEGWDSIELAVEADLLLELVPVSA